MYTANVGEYRPPRNDILCYTEDKLGNPHYSSRLYKILSHIYNTDDWSVYIDADIHLPHGLEEKLIAEVEQSGKLVGAFLHPWRDCVYEEAREIVRLGKDTQENVDVSVKMLREAGYPDHGGLYHCAILVRKNTSLVQELNRRWWQAICVGSKRDQLLFPLIYQDVLHVFSGGAYKYKRWVR